MKSPYERLLTQDMRNERRILWSEIAIVVLLAALAVACVMIA